MYFFIVTITVATFLSYLAENSSFGIRKSAGDSKLNPYFLFALIVFLVFVSGFRYMNYFLSDEYNYRTGVDALKGAPFSLSSVRLGNEWIFGLISWISANVFHSPQALIFIAALVTNVSVVLFFAIYARPFWLAIFIYIAGGAYFASMNVLRQYMAIAVVIWCFHFAPKGKFAAYAALVIVASAIHTSALIMLPLYFVLRLRRVDRWTLIMIILAVYLLFNFDAVMNAILPNTSYDQYLDDILSGGYGVKAVRVAATLLPYAIIIIYRRYMMDYLDLSREMFNNVLISGFLCILSLAYVYVARIDLYFAVAAYAAIAKIPRLFKDHGRGFITVLICALYFIFGCFQMRTLPVYHNVLFEDIGGVL